MDKKALLEKFHQMDTNNDGALSVAEVRNCVRQSGLPDSAVEDFMSLFDLSGDNVITLQEYVSALGLDPPPPKDLKMWKAAFDSLDQDQSGTLCAEEIRDLMRGQGYYRVTQHEIDRWIDQVDKDGDRQISFAEFAAFLELSLQNQ